MMTTGRANREFIRKLEREQEELDEEFNKDQTTIQKRNEYLRINRDSLQMKPLEEEINF